MTTTRYEIEVDATRANQELARLHRSSTSLAGTEKTLENAVTQTNAAIEKQGKEAKKAETQIDRMKKGANRAAEVMGKQAAAIALVSQHLGESNGAMGKAVQSAGMMAAAFGAGGPWAAALVAGIAALDQFNKHLERKIELQDKEIKQSTAVVEAAIESRKKIEARLAEEQKNLRELAMTKAQKDRESWQQEYAQLATQAGKELADAIAAYDKPAEIQARASLRKLEQLRVIMEAKFAAVERISKDANKPAVASKTKENDTEAEINGIPAKEYARQVADAFRRVEEGEFKAEANVNRMLQNMLENRENWQAALTEIDEAGLAKRRRNEERETEARKLNEEGNIEVRLRLQEEYEQKVANLTMHTAAIISISSTQLIADLIGQQEYALERFGISIMAQAGQALVSYGIQGLGEAAKTGIAAVANPLLAPLAITQAGMAGGLIAAGVGLGGVAGGLGQLMGGGAQTQATPGPRMAVPVGGGGDGTSQITIIYGGASGPTAEQGAEAVGMAQARLARRNTSSGRDIR